MEKSISLLLLNGRYGSLEYFCRSCKQLRLSLAGFPKRCGMCDSKNIIVARKGTLNKAALIKLINTRKE